MWLRVNPTNLDLDQNPCINGAYFRLILSFALGDAKVFWISLVLRLSVPPSPSFILLPNICSLAHIRKEPRKPAPGFKRTYQSILLGRLLRLRVTLSTQRDIRDAGGFDRYIYFTPEEKYVCVFGVFVCLFVCMLTVHRRRKQGARGVVAPLDFWLN